MIATNLKKTLESIVNAKLRYGNTQSIKLVAVSKYSQSKDILEAYGFGQRDFGENKVQDLAQKIQQINASKALQAPTLQTDEVQISWHFIGRLQKNKASLLLALQPTLFHSLHSIKLANILQEKLITKAQNQPMQYQQDSKYQAVNSQYSTRKCTDMNSTLHALLQVNSANEASKQGFEPSQVIESYLQIQQECPNIKLCGLMCMGSHSDNRSEIEKSFVITKNLFDMLKIHGAHILSMGMSSDYEIAIAQGSNCLRIGSQIFRSSM